jgi:hypothetical protein
VKKEVKQVISYARDYGFKYEGLTGSGHAKLRHEGGQMIIMGTSPNGGNRWKKNAVALIHRIHTAHKEKKS